MDPSAGPKPAACSRFRNPTRSLPPSFVRPECIARKRIGLSRHGVFQEIQTDHGVGLPLDLLAELLEASWGALEASWVVWRSSRDVLEASWATTTMMRTILTIMITTTMSSMMTMVMMTTFLVAQSAYCGTPLKRIVLHWEHHPQLQRQGSHSTPPPVSALPSRESCHGRISTYSRR